ncbi:deoxyribonuclease-2-beta-like [Perca flavescens]|uniref:deoxyribonuclease-2-beta-like n=1 Tax=Perca flavescens TaxID=8167 RepID=UPI00106E0828|nr:deoxyribonuclease-2-beta-like [Perca flavescens]
MTNNFGFISYSDQPPPDGKPAGPTFGHSKGVVMMDKTTGVWLLHSVPKFPKRDQNKFYPDTGAAKAQTFICVTFNYNQFKQIGEHLLDINAFTFDDRIPDDFHEELKKLRRTGNNNRTPRNNEVRIQELRSAGGTLFCSIASNIVALPTTLSTLTRIRRKKTKIDLKEIFTSLLQRDTGLM